MPLNKSGNAVHKIDKYFIHSAKRDERGRLKLTISLQLGTVESMPRQSLSAKLWMALPSL